MAEAKGLPVVMAGVTQGKLSHSASTFAPASLRNIRRGFPAAPEIAIIRLKFRFLRESRLKPV